MNAKSWIRLFVVLAIAQLVVPAAMIIKREIVLKYGTQFKFKAAPVDPYDAFRGRYVALNIQENNIPVDKGTKIKPGTDVYVFIKTDEQGFAKLAGFSLKRPAAASPPYIKTTSVWVYGDKMQLDMPIKYYYMEEAAAPKAEKAYRAHTQRNRVDAYVLVRVKHGWAVVEGVYLGGQSIQDAAKAYKEK